MTLNKQFINLIGIVLVVIVLVAGVALIAMPMYAQAQTIDANTSAVEQSNTVYQTQIDVLAAANDRSQEIDQALAELQVEITASPQLDDVHEIISAAAKRLDVRIESVVADAEETWTPRTSLDEDGNPVVVEADAATPAAPDSGTANPAPAPSNTGEGDSGDASTATETSAAAGAVAGDAASPQQQVLLTVIIDTNLPFEASADADEVSPVDTGDEEAVDVEDVDDARESATTRAEKAAAFVDQLGAGARLLSPINLDYGEGKLTLSVLAFIRTEDVQ